MGFVCDLGGFGVGFGGVCRLFWLVAVAWFDWVGFAVFLGWGFV